MIIDAHVSIGEGIHLRSTVRELISAMDAAGVEKAVITSVDRYLAVDNRAGNDEIMAAVRDNPDRFIGMASVNPWFGRSAEQELERAFTGGMAGIYINSLYQGFRLDDPIIYPFLDITADFNGIAYLHTGSPYVAEPFHAVLLAERYPQINFIMGHGGSPDYGEDAVVALQQVDNLWIETSRNGPANYNFWKIKGLEDRIVFGSSFPEYYPVTEIATLKDVFTGAAEQEALFSATISHIFNGRL